MKAIIAAALLGGCGSLLGSGDDNADLPERSFTESDAAPAGDASSSGDAAEPQGCTKVLPCGGTDVAETGELVPPPSRLCLEACVKLSYDVAGFGDAGEDFVKIVDVKLSDEGGLVGDFNIGIARKPYLFASGQGSLAVIDWSSEKMPRDRWIHFRVDLRYAAPAEAQVFVDRELVTEGSIPALVRPPTKAVVTPGPLPNGTHPEAEIEFALRRLTRH